MAAASWGPAQAFDVVPGCSLAFIPLIIPWPSVVSAECALQCQLGAMNTGITTVTIIILILGS